MSIIFLMKFNKWEFQSKLFHVQHIIINIVNIIVWIGLIIKFKFKSNLRLGLIIDILKLMKEDNFIYENMSNIE